MNGVRKLLIALLILALLASVAGGLVWCSMHYVLIDRTFYSRDLEQLDLRDHDISGAQHDRYSRYLPECEILWDIPFQGKRYPSDTKTLTVTELHEQDFAELEYFTELTSIDASQCRDYTVLRSLEKQRPDLKIDYSVKLGGQSYSPDATAVVLQSVTDADVKTLHYLPQLKQVTAAPGEDAGSIRALQSYCHEMGIEFMLRLGEDTVRDDLEELTIRQARDEDLTTLELLPNLKNLTLNDPKASPDTVLGLEKTHPGLKVSWSKTVWGVPMEADTEELDLSEAENGTLEELEEGLSYYPSLKQVFLGKTQLDYEDLFAFREKHRQDYKVVWTVNFRNKLFIRTDAKYFFACPPNKVGICNFNDTDAKNLKYLEEVEAIDIGHMPIHEVDFLEFMPKLKYLILSWTEVKRIDAVKHCKELIFLEVTDSCLRTLEGVQYCTALEDLNFGGCWPDVTPITEMTWLKHVYLIKGSGSDAGKLGAALPDTTVVASGTHTVASGWRKLPNYYAMRDALEAPYMN